MDELNTSREELSSVDVSIRVSFTKIFDIDTINQRFQAEVIVESRWHDPTLKSLNDDISKAHWKPDLYVENAINDPKEETSLKIIKNQDGLLMISEIRRIRGTFWENLELENFPLDVQDLSITIASKKSGSKVNFILIQSEIAKVNINSNLDKSMWYLHDMVKTNIKSIQREYSFGKYEYPCIQTSCQVFRLPGYFYWNVLLPMILILLASLAPFVFDYKLPQSRLPSTATMLLSAVSYKISVSKLLPTVSYLTSLDKYSIASIGIITVMLIYHAFIGGLGHILEPRLAYRIDKFFLFTFIALIILKQLIFVSWLSDVNIKREELIENHMFYEHENAEKNEEEKKDQ